MATSLRLSDFYYDLPPELIAQYPAEPRDHSRLLVVAGGSTLFQHYRFDALERLLRPGDVLVVNVTRVFPARLRGKKATGGKIELLLIAPEGDDWRALVRGADRPVNLVLPGAVGATMRARRANGEWLVHFSTEDVRGYLGRYGEMPLPPYIKRPAAESTDHDRYQTVYAASEGAVAAPTAGFHFTSDLLERLARRGIQRTEIVLHVGWGTFRPIRQEAIAQHEMLPERFEVSAQAAAELNQARAERRRIIAVGTTVVRTLETVIDPSGSFRPGSGESHLFITPGYRFRAVDALITNFHLPDSTPLLLANAFYAHRYPAAAHFPFVLRPAYDEAIGQRYRFYSYGDAMLIQ